MKTTILKILILTVFSSSFINIFGVSVQVSNINIPLVCSDYTNLYNKEVYISQIPYEDMIWEFQLYQDDGTLVLTNLMYYTQYSDGFYFHPGDGWINTGDEGWVSINFGVLKANRINGAYKDLIFKCRYKLSFPNAPWSPWISREFRVKVNDLIISGGRAVCYSPNKTFTISGYPASSSFSWTKSSNIYAVSGGGSTTYTVRAISSHEHDEGYVKATVTNSTCTWEKQHDVWVGIVLPLGLRLIDRTTGLPKYYFCKYEANPVQAKHIDGEAYIDDWDWDVSGGIITYDNPYGDNSKATLRPTSSSWEVKIRAENGCGWSEWADLSGDLILCGYYFTMSPNPANDYVDISIEKPDNVQSIGNFEIKIYSVLQKAVYETSLSNKSLVRVNTSHLQDGMYFVHLIVGKEKVVKQLIVSH